MDKLKEMIDILGYVKEQLTLLTKQKQPIELSEYSPIGYAIIHLEPDHILCECGTELQKIGDLRWKCPKCGNEYFIGGQDA